MKGAQGGKGEGKGGEGEEADSLAPQLFGRLTDSSGNTGCGHAGEEKGFKHPHRLLPQNAHKDTQLHSLHSSLNPFLSAV